MKLSRKLLVVSCQALLVLCLLSNSILLATELNKQQLENLRAGIALGQKYDLEFTLPAVWMVESSLGLPSELIGDNYLSYGIGQVNQKTACWADKKHCEIPAYFWGRQMQNDTKKAMTISAKILSKCMKLAGNDYRLGVSCYNRGHNGARSLDRITRGNSAYVAKVMRYVLAFRKSYGGEEVKNNPLKLPIKKVKPKTY